MLAGYVNISNNFYHRGWNETGKPTETRIRINIFQQKNLEIFLISQKKNYFKISYHTNNFINIIMGMYVYFCYNALHLYLKFCTSSHSNLCVMDEKFAFGILLDLPVETQRLKQLKL